MNRDEPLEMGEVACKERESESLLAESAAFESGEVRGAREEQQSERLLTDSTASASRSASHEPITREGACEEPQSDRILTYDEIKERIREMEEKEKENKKKFENDLLETIRKGNDFEKIKNTITPKALGNCYSNSLLMSMKVSFELRRLADRKGPDEERVNQLANSVEEFGYCLLDPLRSDQDMREQFGNYCLDFIMDDAIELSKKVFTHPVITDEMNGKWYGRNSVISTWTTKWYLKLFLSILCIFDLVFSPILFTVCSLLKERRSQEGGCEDSDSVVDIYLMSFETPYFKFVRDTVSYIVLVFLHYAVCLSPSTIAFSGLEWTILIFFVGRYLVERKQICDILQRIKRRRENEENVGAQSKWLRLKSLKMYLSDRWNRLDFFCLLVYLVILTLSVATPIVSGSVRNNRALAIASYLYGFNALCLTFRIFGQVMEQSKEMGIIQIALFSILKDIRAIIWQFLAAILAFSIAITKVYMAEESFLANGSDGNDNACKKSAISCWWAMITQLIWSLLGESKEFDHMMYEDIPSKTLARIFYAGFLIMGLILLINLLIALLTNTYQRVQDNSKFEWSFKRLVTCQTYDAYDPIPVPMNIIYSIYKLIKLVVGKVKGKKDEGREDEGLMDRRPEWIINWMEDQYFKKYGHVLPGEDNVEGNVKRVLHETETTRQLVSQIVTTTFRRDQGVLYCGPKEWDEVDQSIRIEGLLLTCEGMEGSHGVRHRQSFSSEFSHFEVAILEIGGDRRLGVGVVYEGYSTKNLPGWMEGSVGYYTDDGKIYHGSIFGRKTEGPVLARRGDRIRCTVMFENKREEDGKVPVFFTLNGNKIIMEDGEYQIFMDADKPLYPYIAMTDGCSVLVKMCSREDLDSKYTVQSMEKRMTAEIKEQNESSIGRFEKLEKGFEEMRESNKATNQKLDTLLAILTDNKKDPPKV